MNIFGTPISAYKSALSTDPVTVKLSQFIDDRKRVSDIFKIRNSQDQKERELLKRSLPAATISGTFRHRAVDGLQEYNGLVCMDFDGKDNPDHTAEQMKSILAEFDEVAYASISVSGKGVYAILPTNNTDPRRHSDVVRAIGGLFHAYGLKFDKACTDVSRLRFISFDSEDVRNPDASVIDVTALLPQETFVERPPRPVFTGVRKTSNNRTERRVQDVLQQIVTGHIDITQDYQEWCKVGFALANEFGWDGEEYFQQLSQFHPKYDQAECHKKYENFVRSGRQIKIGSFFEVAKRYNLNP